MIPNSTQIPNNLFNGEMQEMKDTELRVVLIVARKTLGWIENLETGMRKEEDWISHSQLTKFTGRTSRALSTAIDSCIKKKWIEARSQKGDILDAKQKRAGKKIFYRLGKTFLKSKEVNETSEKSKEVESEPLKKVQLKKVQYTKETILQNNNMSQATDWNSQKEIDKLLKDKKRHIQVIGVWIKERDLNPENKEQLQSIIKRNLRAARLLEGYKNEDIARTIKVLEGTDYLSKFTLETTLKYVDEVIAQKKKEGPRIIRFDRELRDGREVVIPIYEK